MSVQFKDIGGECCQPGNRGCCFLLSSCVKSYIHMCMLIQKYWTRGWLLFLTLGNWFLLTSLQNFTGPFVRISCDIVRDDCKSTSSSMDFPSSMEGTTFYTLVDMSPAVVTVKGSLAKPITFVGRVNPSNRLTKFSCNLAMKSVCHEKVQFDLECANLFHKFSDIFVSAR